MQPPKLDDKPSGDLCDSEWMVGPYLDGELPDGERRGVEDHLESCTPCRRLADQFRDLDQLARSTLETPRVSAEEWGTVWQTVQQRASRPIAPVRSLRDWIIPALSAAALILFGVWAFVVLFQPPEPSTPFIYDVEGAPVEVTPHEDGSVIEYPDVHDG